MRLVSDSGAVSELTLNTAGRAARINNSVRPTPEGAISLRSVFQPA